MRIDDYLQRIGWTGRTKPTLETLGRLMRAHNHNIPFENIDVQLGAPLTTSVEAAYDKIVNRRRGGWCYEQNGVLGWALSQLGFDVQRVSAAVMRAAVGANSNANHLTLVVTLPGDDTRWLVDAGFGGSMLHPMAIGEATAHHAPFDVGLRRLNDGYWQFWENPGDAEFSFDFQDKPADEAAMSARCQYLQTCEESGFVKNLVCQLRRPTAQRSLRGKVLRETTDQGKTERTLDSAQELTAVLQNDFGLDLPEAAGLWHRICQRHEEIIAKRA